MDPILIFVGILCVIWLAVILVAILIVYALIGKLKTINCRLLEIQEIRKQYIVELNNMGEFNLYREVIEK